MDLATGLGVGAVIGVVVGSAFGSVVGGLILMLFGRAMTRLPNIGYLNSYGVSFLATVLYFVAYLGIASAVGPMELMKVGFAGIAGLSLVLLTVSYGVVAQQLWKTSFGNAVKGTLIMPVSVALLMGAGAGFVFSR
ncbi:MAG: hypothetical protein RL653_1838 [Pseudomonadota bacterium]